MRDENQWTLSKYLSYQCIEGEMVIIGIHKPFKGNRYFLLKEFSVFLWKILIDILRSKNCIYRIEYLKSVVNNNDQIFANFDEDKIVKTVNSFFEYLTEKTILIPCY